ncbi:MAG: ABC transporter permease [Actinophytocola sp.]
MVLVALLGLVAVLILGPMLLLLYGSFRTNSPGLPASFTLSRYVGLFDADFAQLALNTLIIATGSTALSLFIGLGLGIIIVRTNVPGARLLNTAVTVPAFIAPFIGAIAWILLLSPSIGYVNAGLNVLGIGPLNVYTMPGIIWVMGLYFAPVAYLYIRPALLAFDSGLDEAARVFGATRFSSLVRIALPLILPAILSSVLVVFVNAAGQFGIPGVLGNPGNIEVIATRLVRLTTVFPADVNTAAVLGIVLTVITVGGLAINRRVIRKREYASIGTRGSSGTRTDLGRLRYPAIIVCWGYVAVSVVLPLGAMLIGSLQPFVSPDFSSGWTLNNYADLATPRAANAILNSTVLAVGAAVTGAVLAAAIAVFLIRTRFRMNAALDYVASLPLAVPSSVFGLALLWMWISIPAGVYGTKIVLFAAYVALFLPYAIRVTVTAMQQIDVSVEHAGRVFGASWLGVIRKILVPLLIPGLLSGGTIILYHSIRELAASLLLYTPSSEVMSVLIWESYEVGDFVHVFALGVVNVVLVFALVAVATRLTGGTERR